jgi:dimethylamine monooxygenase subunit A
LQFAARRPRCIERHFMPTAPNPDFVFDFEQIALPFRMRPGLAQLPDGAPQLTLLREGSALALEKRAIFEAGLSRHTAVGFDPAVAIENIAARARNTWATGQFDTKKPIEATFQEDFAVLDGAIGKIVWLCVCTPSHWAPEEKIGLDFAAVHAPVADNAALVAASRQLVQLVTGGCCWERFVWTISPSGRYDQHPHRHARAAWPAEDDAARFAAQCFLRVERQTFFPIEGGPRQAVFTIQVMLEALPLAVDTAAKAARLLESLASMSDAVADYKGLSLARPVLLRWLRMLCA